MKTSITTIFLVLLLAVSPFCHAQDLFVEASGTASSGKHAPLWLTSNKHDLVSPYANSAYERAGIIGSVPLDTAHQLKLDYAIDLQLKQNAQTPLMVHQAYAELQWMKVHLLVGQKEHELDYRNERLTSGGLGNGINALPIPVVMVKTDYFSTPFTNHWWKMRYRLGYGRTTDGTWQRNWARDNTRYTSNTLYHEKVITWKFGREEKFPLALEASLQMMTQFGGVSYNANGRGHHEMKPIVHPQNIKAFWEAFWPIGSSDVTDGDMPNSAGNTFGSYVFALGWYANVKEPIDKQWYMRAYFERMFEDQSMLTVQYGIYDHLLGFEVALPKNPYVSHFLVEHISSKDQAGPVYHDKTVNIPESYCGQDNYYNHHLYTGWQNWGICMGNPLFKSPIYNDNHILTFENNRLQAWHIGIDGNPSSEWAWRMMASFTRNWGTYANPYPDVMPQQHYLAETTYRPSRFAGLQATLAFGIDHGSVFGNSTGIQLTVRKSFKL